MKVLRLIFKKSCDQMDFERLLTEKLNTLLGKKKNITTVNLPI